MTSGDGGTGVHDTTDRCPDCGHELDVWCGCHCCAWWRGDESER